MGKLILVLLILLPFTNTFSQKTKLQELKEQLRNHPQQDTFRVNRLNDIALRSGLSTACAGSAANEVLLLSRLLNYKEGEVYTLIAQAGIKDGLQGIDLIKQDFLHHQAYRTMYRLGFIPQLRYYQSA